MNTDEIIRWFRRFKYDQEFRDENNSLTVRITPLCEFVGINRTNLYAILARKRPLGDGHRKRLEYAIQCVQNGLRWHRPGRNCKYEVAGPEFPALPRYEYPKSRRAA